MSTATALAHDLALALDPARLMAAMGYPPDAWQARVLRSTAERTLLNCSRQSGKSVTCAALALHMALYQPGSPILLLSPSLRQSQELFKKVQDGYRALAHPAPLQAESALRYELTTGSRIIAIPGQEATVRGYSGVDLLVIDEAVRVADELYYSVRPMLATSGGRLVALSTPFGQAGFFFETWEHGAGWERGEIRADQCPRISERFLAEERASMPDYVFQREYWCRFVQTEAHVFRLEDLQDMMDATVEPWTFLQRGG